MQAVVRSALGLAALGVAFFLAGCGGDDDGRQGGTIAILLSESSAGRAGKDLTMIRSELEALCPDCRLLYRRAGRGDEREQERQARWALAQRPKVLVLRVLGPGVAGAILKEARRRRVKVVAYDQLIRGIRPDYVVLRDSTVAPVQAGSLVEELAANGYPQGPILMINSSNLSPFKRALHIDTHTFLDSTEVATTSEFMANAQTARARMLDTISRVGLNGFRGVYAADDGIAAGVISAMRSVGIDPSKRPVTGAGATLGGVRRVLTGEQHMTVYRSARRTAAAAARLAVVLARGERPSRDLVNDRISHGDGFVPLVRVDPVVVTGDNVAETVIRDGVLTMEQICTNGLADLCEASGLGRGSEAESRRRAPGPWVRPGRLREGGLAAAFILDRNRRSGYSSQ